MDNFIEIKRKCTLIVTETDLTTVLSVLDSNDCKKMNVSLHRNADKRENILWCVSFRTTDWVWNNICRNSKEVCSNEILIPLKDYFGNIKYHEA